MTGFVKILVLNKCDKPRKEKDTGRSMAELSEENEADPEGFLEDEWDEAAAVYAIALLRDAVQQRSMEGRRMLVVEKNRSLEDPTHEQCRSGPSGQRGTRMSEMVVGRSFL